jgi:phage terminase large subunit-like protein
MMVIGFGSDGRKYVIDFIRDKMKLSEKTSAILELAEKWRPSVIFWEENASVEGGEHIEEVLEKVIWPIAPRREPMGGGMYRGKKVSKKGGGVFGR